MLDVNDWERNPGGEQGTVKGTRTTVPFRHQAVVIKLETRAEYKLSIIPDEESVVQNQTMKTKTKIQKKIRI